MSARVLLLGLSALLLALASTVRAQNLSGREHSVLRSPPVIAHSPDRGSSLGHTRPVPSASAGDLGPEAFSCAERPFLEALFRSPAPPSANRSPSAAPLCGNLGAMIRSTIALVKQSQPRAALLAGLGDPTSEKPELSKSLTAASLGSLLGALPASTLRDSRVGLDADVAMSRDAAGSPLKPGASWGERAFKGLVKLWSTLQRVHHASQQQLRSATAPAPRVPYLGL